MARDIFPVDPFRELLSIREELDRLFSTLATGRGVREGRETLWLPAVDVEETDDAVIVRAEVPGMEKDDIKVTITDDTLVISGERREEKEEKEKNYHHREIYYGKFYRAVRLPVDVDREKAKASYKQGILEIVLPKSERVKPRTIDVEVR